MTRVLAGDIGATHARFALHEDARRVARAEFASDAYPDAERFLAAALEALGTDRVEACCIAMAGPVAAGSGAMTNTGLRWDAEAVAAYLGVTRAHVVNDLVALGEALDGIERASLRQLGGAVESAGTRAVIAPGTGLGMAIVVADGPASRCLPSEGGHAPFAPADPLEQEVLGFLAEERGYVSWEDVLSGPGLVNVYRAVCNLWGTRPALDAPESIAEHAVDAADPVCHQTLGMFCAILGSAAGALAVTACATGGVFVGGGIVPGIVDFVAESGFRRRFEERGVLTEYVARIPVFAGLDPDAGLDGALRYALRSRAA